MSKNIKVGDIVRIKNVVLDFIEPKYEGMKGQVVDITVFPSVETDVQASVQYKVDLGFEDELGHEVVFYIELGDVERVRDAYNGVLSAD